MMTHEGTQNLDRHTHCQNNKASKNIKVGLGVFGISYGKTSFFKDAIKVYNICSGIKEERIELSL